MKKLLLSLTILSASAAASAGPDPAAATASYIPSARALTGGIYHQFDSTGEKYIKMNIWDQSWARVIQNNPGTMVNNDPQKWTLDAGNRRLRWQIYGQMSRKFLLMLQLGTNNESFATGGNAGAGKEAPFYVHDAYAQLNILPDYDYDTHKENKYTLEMGLGIHGFAGVSRLTSASAISILGSDNPGFNWPTVNIADQDGRMFGIFAKGFINKIGYRVSVNKPFVTSNTPKVGGPAVDNNKGATVAMQGYFDYQFFDRDIITTPFLAGSYYGRKKMINVGAGFLYYPKATMDQPVTGVFNQHAVSCFGADIFMDLPVGDKRKDMVYTLYAVWYNYNFGPKYLRTAGVMNPGTADPNFTGTMAYEGVGNAAISMGTGNLFYAQSAFLLPRFTRLFRMQPYANIAVKSLDALNQTGYYWAAGNNFLIFGTNAKISLEYNNRPLYSATDRKIFTHRGEIRTVFQVAL